MPQPQRERSTAAATELPSFRAVVEKGAFAPPFLCPLWSTDVGIDRLRSRIAPVLASAEPQFCAVFVTGAEGASAPNDRFRPIAIVLRRRCVAAVCFKYLIN